MLLEVVRRETHDDQPLRGVLGIHCFQAFVLLGEAAVAGGVDYQQHLARVLAQRLRLLVLQAGQRVLQQRRAGRRGDGDGGGGGRGLRLRLRNERQPLQGPIDQLKFSSSDP